MHLEQNPKRKSFNVKEDTKQKDESKLWQTEDEGRQEWKKGEEVIHRWQTDEAEAGVSVTAKAQRTQLKSKRKSKMIPQQL